MFTPLSRRLSAWVKNGLISEGQAEAILIYESQAGGRSWVSFGVVGIGVTAIATGVLSLVAANWESIPPSVKWINYLLVQALAGYLFLRQEKSQSVWREAFLLLFVALFWAGIGLYAQIFNLEGEGWSACLFWLAVSLPAVALAKRALLPHLWTIMVGVTAVLWMSASWRYGQHEDARPFIIAAVPLALAATSFWTQALGLLSPQFKGAFTFWGIGTYSVAITVLGNGLWEAQAKKISPETMRYLLIPWGALIAAMAGSLVRREPAKVVRQLTALFLFLVGLYATVPLFIEYPYADKVTFQLIGAVGFIVVAGVGAYLAAVDHQKRLYEIATQLIALRFIVIYFQVFGTLSTTGVGLIFSGVVILGVAYFWNSWKKKWFARVNRGGSQ